MSLLFHIRRFSVNSFRHASVSQETYWQKYRRTLKEHPLPIWAGLLMVGFLQYRRIVQRNKDQREYEVKTGKAEFTNAAVYEILPLSSVSRLFGSLSEVQLPHWARRTLLSWYVKTYGCDLSEACIEDVTEYSSLAALFKRELKSGARNIDFKAPLTSPCDGKVLSCGTIDSYGYLEQIKGMSYPLRDFVGPYLGEENGVKIKNLSRLFHITIYLAPGDYHHFHSPTEWDVLIRRHYPGKLLSVGVWAAKTIPRLFVQNERAVYLGTWAEGFFSMTAVGATNVGSISIEFDSDLKTNQKDQFSCDERLFAGKMSMEKGQHFGQFNLGSTVVLVFEAAENFNFNVEPGQKILMGQALGDFVEKSNT